LPAFKGFLLALAGVMIAAALSGCGRKGGLDLPPDAAATPPPAAAYDAQGNPVPAPKKQFILDPLLR
jgi:predicted small lipoprotein YifL